MIKLIITADDFGMSPLFNKGILELLMAGRVTSTSVMVNRDSNPDDFTTLIKFSCLKNYSIGLHLEFKDELFESSINNQFEKFEKIFNKYPSHLDVHKGLKFKTIFPFILKFAYEKNIPFRNHGVFCNKNLPYTTTPFFYATGRSFKEIINWINNLKSDSVNEIVFHPGYYDVNSTSSLNKERESDFHNIIQLTDYLSNHKVELTNFTWLR